MGYKALQMIAILIILASFLPPLSSGGNASGDVWEVTVVIQFGNGEVFSAMVYLPSDNHTAIKATELACGQLNLELNYSWSSYGALVNQIGWEKNDWSGSGYYWHLMVWENDSSHWVNSNVGASSLNLSEGDVIAWVYTVDDSSWVPYTGAVASPGHYFPWSSPRGNLNNTGVSHGNVVGNEVIWKFKGESSWGFSSTPVASMGLIFIADSSALYALNMNGSLLWSNEKGAAGYYGIASPTVFNRYVIIGTSDQYLRAFYIPNGTLAWEVHLGEDVTSAPVVDIYNRIPYVFVTTFNFNSVGKLYAFYLQNGTEAWNLTLMGSNYFGVPAIYNGKIIVPIAGIEDSSYAWNPPYGIQCINENGTYGWNYTSSSSIRSPPTVVGNRIYFVTTGGNLTALDMNGTEIWKIEIGSSTAPLSVVNGTIYVGTDDGKLYAIKDEGLYPTQLWSEELNGPVKAGILYASGKVMAITDTENSTIYCYSSSGDLLWNYTPKPENYILSSPIIADSYLLVASNNGYLIALGDNSSFPSIDSIIQEQAYVGRSIKIMVDAPEEYQAILYYRNVSGDEFHTIWMNYSDGRYIGYIPPQQSTGKVYYYVTIVASNGLERTSGIKIIQVQGEIPEMSQVPLLIIIVLFLIAFLRNRAHG